MSNTPAVQCSVSTNSFFISEEIDQDVLFQLLKFLLEAKGPTVYIYIDSIGGCVDSAFAMYEALKACPHKVVTQAVESVSSASVLIYVAGEERYISPHASFLVHKVASTRKTRRDTDEVLVERSKLMAEATKNLFDLICKETKLTRKLIDSKIRTAPDGDWTFGVDDALKHGVAHEVGFIFPNKKKAPPTDQPSLGRTGAAAKKGRR